MENTEFKVGDRVKIVDESYVAYLDQTRGVPYHMMENGGYSRGDNCTVVAVNCEFPLMDMGSKFQARDWPTNKKNDTLVFNYSKNMFAFVCHEFLVPVCPVKKDCCPCKNCEYRGRC